MPFTRSLQAQLLKQAVPRRPLAASLKSRQLLSKRYNSTTTTSSTTPQSQPQQSTNSRRFRTLLYIALFGGIGLAAGSKIEKLLALPPVPGSKEDVLRTKAIQTEYEFLPIVKQLRDDPDYEQEWTAYSNFSDEQAEHRLTSGALKGSSGLALQKIFYNEKEKTVVNVVFFGTALDGWPTIVHGGVLATVLDETFGRVAIRSFPAQTGVTATLDINYRAPVSSENFYIVRVSLDKLLSTDRKAYMKGEIRDQNGKLCVEATSLFVVPKNIPLKKLGGKF